jgi:hypothetical protein
MMALIKKYVARINNMNAIIPGSLAQGQLFKITYQL